MLPIEVCLEIDKLISQPVSWILSITGLDRFEYPLARNHYENTVNPDCLDQFKLLHRPLDPHPLVVLAEAAA